MIANNIFKFVSIRPPALETRNDPRFLKNKAEVAAVARLRKELAKTHDLARARLSLGAEMMDAADYYSNQPVWQSLRPSTSIAASILQDLTKSPGLADFEGKAESLFKDVLGTGDLREFLAGETYGKLVGTLWPSYYATVLNPYPKAQDREEMIVWIRFFTLMDNMDNKPAFDAMAKQIQSLRPAVPIDFYNMTEPSRLLPQPEPTHPAGKPDPNRDKRKQLIALEAARDHLTSKFAAKTAAYRAMTTRVAVRENVRTTATRPSRGNKLALATSFNRPQDAPWQPKPEDFKDAEEKLNALVKAGLDPKIMNLPEMIYGAEQKIAELAVSLAEDSRSPTVTFSGRIPVEVRGN